MGMYSLLCLKWISRTDLLSSAQNSAQYHVAVWMGRGFGGRMCVCVAESLQCPPETVAAVIGYAPVQNKKCFWCFFPKERVN